MRHGKIRTSLGRMGAHRKATLRSLACALIKKERIITTCGKAKVAGGYTEKLITLAKTDSLAARRRALSMLADIEAVRILFAELGPRFKNRNGGYTRVLKYSFRPGDGAPKAVLELVELKPKKEKVKKEKAKAKPEEKPKAEKPQPLEKPKAPVKERAPEKPAEKPAEKPKEAKGPEKGGFLKGIKGLFGKKENR